MSEAAATQARVIQVPFADHMIDKFMSYAMSVLQDRALPDIRDGLKPVHRHILYAMYGLGLHPNSQYKKCARTVGECLGRLHPHGDQSVYDAMIVAAQDWKMRYPLIDIHGNKGSSSGAPAAAMRYTEGKLSPYGEMMMNDIDKDTVHFIPNYDESETEPEVMPSLFAQLLLNGTNGIAVGMNSEFLPHNATDVYKAVDLTISNAMKGKDTSIDDLIDIIVAPDFPTGGVITNQMEVQKAYREGHGRCIVRAKYHMEQYGKRKDREAIVVTEVPYGVNLSKLVYSIGKLTDEDEDFKDIHEVRDETDRNGIRIVIELEKDALSNIVINRLLKRTDLQRSVSIHHNALIDGKPHMNLSLKTMVDKFLEHATNVLYNKANYEHGKLEKRLHIINAYLIALNDTDKTFELMKAKSRKDACQNLKDAYNFDDEQATAVAALHLYSFSDEDKDKLEKEYETLDTEYKRYDNIIKDEMALLEYVRAELRAVADKFKNDKRLTEISNETDARDIIPDIDVVIAYTHNGYIKSVKLDEYSAQNRSGKGVEFKTKDDDFVEAIYTLSTHDDLVVVTSTGKAYILPAYKIPTVSKSSIGKPINNYINIPTNEKVVKLLPVKKDKITDDLSIMFITKLGIGKRLSVNDLPQTRSGAKIISLKENDELVSCFIVKEGSKIMTTTKNGMSLMVEINDKNYRNIGRQAAGVRAMKLKDNDYIISACMVKPNSKMFVITDIGIGKRFEPDVIHTQARAGLGVRCYNITKSKSNKLIAMTTIEDSEDLMIITSQGKIIRVPASNISICGRTAIGVKIIKLSDGDEITSITTASTSISKE